MKNFTELSSDERKNIIQEIAGDLGLRFDIIEKDIWVCYILQKLFSNQELKDNLVFKGGTCLSKAYSAIDRFSEDVDITINESALNIKGDSKKISKIKSRNREATRVFVENKILPILKKSCDDDLGYGNYDFSFDEEDQNNITLFFEFPYPSRQYLTGPMTKAIPLDSNEKSVVIKRSGNIINKGNYNYIKPKIKLEFGALGGFWPLKKKEIQPYAKKILPKYFDAFEVNTLDIKRNFIEKLLILHSIVFRPQDKLVNQNYSRHYYDVYSIIQKGININHIKDLEILTAVVKNKKEFWNESWVNYDKIKEFCDIELVPDDARIKEIKKDYKNMEEMFFKDSPAFDEIILLLHKFKDSVLINDPFPQKVPSCY